MNMIEIKNIEYTFKCPMCGFEYKLSKKDINDKWKVKYSLFDKNDIVDIYYYCPKCKSKNLNRYNYRDIIIERGETK